MTQGQAEQLKRVCSPELRNGKGPGASKGWRATHR